MMKFLTETKRFLRPAMPFPPLFRGRVRVGVEFGYVYGKCFYPHPNLPPARGKEQWLVQVYQCVSRINDGD
jgi:hypothetical protein